MGMSIDTTVIIKHNLIYPYELDKFVDILNENKLNQKNIILSIDNKFASYFDEEEKNRGIYDYEWEKYEDSLMFADDPDYLSSGVLPETRIETILDHMYITKGFILYDPGNIDYSFYHADEVFRKGVLKWVKELSKVVPLEDEFLIVPDGDKILRSYDVQEMDHNYFEKVSLKDILNRYKEVESQTIKVLKYFYGEEYSFPPYYVLKISELD